MKAPVIALAVAAAAAGTLTGAEEATPLRAGAYEVNVRLELPHVEDAGVAAKARICVTADGAGTRGLAVLGDGNPLQKCPVSNVRRDGATLSFDIVCPGPDAAVGAARYTMWPERFEGAIAVKMGGKSMTMVERQSGHRVGRCTSERRRS